jgi:hypothetical protein
LAEEEKMDKLALAEEVLVRLQRGENPDRFAGDLEAFLKDPACWRETDSGLAVPETDEQGWMQKVYRDLGIECVVPPIPALTRRQKKSLEKFGFRPFFIPSITEEAYPASFVKSDWGRHLDASQIERRPLPGRWVAVETVVKPNWNDPKGYPDDELARVVKLEQRFGVSWDDLHQGGLLERIAKATGFPKKGVRLPTAEEWNFLANLFLAILSLRGEVLPDLGATDSWEWCENAYESDNRLIMGNHRGHGGLANVNRVWRDNRNDSIAFRVLAVL